MSGENIIHAFSAGNIDSLSVTVGQMVNPGDSLLQIIPNSIENYFIILCVPNDVIPYITPGDKVNVRYGAFPAQKFGQFSATIAYAGKSLPLSNGMTAQSTLFLEKRKIYQWMLSPFYDMKHSATGPINE